MARWPLLPPPAGLPSYVSRAITAFVLPDPSGIPGLLGVCHAHYEWTSVPNGGRTQVVTGGALSVGTVFARELPVYPAGPGGEPGAPARWNTAEAWVKLRLNDIARFSRVEFQLNSVGSPYSVWGGSQDWLPLILSNTWIILYAKWPVRVEDTWEGWTDQNLRATLTCWGVNHDHAADCGLTSVDVEYFAFRLSEEESE